MGAPRSPRDGSLSGLASTSLHRTTSSTGSIKVEPFRSSFYPTHNSHNSLHGHSYSPRSHSNHGLYAYPARPGSRVRAFMLHWLPTPLRRLVYLHPTAYLIPCFLFFFLIASSSLSQSPDNHPLEILQELPLHPFAPFNIKCQDAPKNPLQIRDVWIDEVREDEEHRVTVIALHGFNDRNKWIDPLKSAFPYVKWIHPKGRLINITANEGYSHAGWYDIKSFINLHEDEDRPGMLETQREINELIRQEREVFLARGEPPRIVVAGFGQGATMALLNALTATEPLEGAIVLSGYLPVPSKALEIASSTLKSTPIFWGHGRKDPYFSASLAEGDATALRLPPYSLTNVQFKAYDGLEHHWRADEVDDLVEWFAQTVPSERRTISEQPMVEVGRQDEDDEDEEEDAKPMQGYGRPNPAQIGVEKPATEDNDGLPIPGRIDGPKRLPTSSDKDVLKLGGSNEHVDAHGQVEVKTVISLEETTAPRPEAVVVGEGGAAGTIDRNEDGHAEDTLSDLVKQAEENRAPLEAKLLDPAVLEDEVQDLPLEEGDVAVVGKRK